VSQAAVPNNPEAISRQVTATDSGTVTLNDEVIDLGEKLPKFFFSNVRMLARFQPQVRRIGDAALTREYEALNQEHARFLQATARQLLEEKSEHLRHYMNQSRYGLARMHDPDAVGPK
jgi:hypothetical protein